MKKTFDSVSWMRSRREQIDKEDASLSWAQKKLRTRESLVGDPLWQKLKLRLKPECGREEPADGEVAGVREHP